MNGIKALVPLPKDVEVLNNIIHAVIRNEDPIKFMGDLSRIGKNLLSRGAELIVLGCTELPLVGINSQVQVVDSLDVLARALLDKHYDRHV